MIHFCLPHKTLKDKFKYPLYNIYILNGINLLLMSIRILMEPK